MFLGVLDPLTGGADHCIDVLREFIMCAGDIGAITYFWEEGRNDPMPDFSVWQVCRNFGEIQSWLRNRTIY